MIKILKLSDVCRDIIDCPHESPVWLTEGYARVIRNFNLIDGQISDAEPYYVDENTYNKRTRRAIPEPGDIIFSREAPIGNCAIVPEGFKCCLGQRLVLLKVDHSKVSSNYLLTVLMSNYVKYQIEQVSKRGSIVSNFNIGDLSNLKIPVLTNQSDIAQFANSISSKITNNRCINNKLESLAKTIYDYWFLQFEFPNEEGKPYKSSGGKMVWCEELKREIPEGWEVIAFNTIGEFFKGKIPSKELTLSPTGDSVSPYVTIDVANNASPLYCNPERMTPLNGETIMVMDGAASGDVYVGNKGTLGSTFSKITSLREDISNPLIYMLLKEHSVIYKKANTGSTVPHANPSFIKQMKFALPKKCERMSHTLNVIFDQITNCRKQNQELESFRNFLLPMLMNGQVTFKDK